MSGDDAVRPLAGVVRNEAFGGDSPCWLPELCPACGALTGDPAAACWRCGLPPSART